MHVITYQYDALGRRIARNLDNVDTTAYDYDKAGRVTSIKFNNEAPVRYEWDAASRLTVKTLSNGVRMEYQYDAASRLLGITYRKPDNTVINSIAYGYDAKGQRTSKTTTLPSRDETPFTATYDAADRMLTFTLTGSGEIFNLAYDDNGNLVSKISQSTGQTTTYTWNTRSWLTAITGPGLTASFAYDALGRRIEKTVNGQSVGFLYDGSQVIAELAGNTVNVKLLSGIAVDEMLARYTAAAARHYLTDALGSVVAMLKDDASVQNYYAYSPYGETTPSANDDGNSSVYTGRENDLTGVYYYRARYFDPVLKRFISGDPIGLVGGLNFYTYVGENPVSFVDPFGLSYLVYNNNLQKLYVLDGSGDIIQKFDAANNAQTGSRGSWPEGTYNIDYFRFHKDDSPSSKFGSNGNVVFDLPGCRGCGVHSGHRDKKDKAGRKGYKHATDGCIRTTDDATSLIQQLEKSDDPVESLTVIDRGAICDYLLPY